MSIDDGEGGILTNDADAELADSDDDAAANLSDIDDNNQAVDTYDDAESADFDTQQKAEALALHVMQTANASGHLAAIDAFDQANPSPWADLAAAQAAALAAQQTSQADAQLTQSNAQADAQETAEQARADALSSEDDSDAQAEDTQETTDAQSEHDQAVAQATMADGVSDDLPDTLVAPADGPDQTLTADFVRGGYEANDFWVGGNPGLFWEFAQSFIPELGAPAFMPSDLAFVPLMYLPVGSGDGQMPYGLLGPDPRTYGPADGTFYGESSVVTAPGVVYGNPVPYPLYGLARDGFFPDSGVYGPAMHFRGPSADLLDLSKAPSAVGSGGYSSSPLPTTTAGTQLPNPSATSSAATPMSLSAPTQSGTGQFAGIQSAAAEESGSGGETAPQTPAEAPATEEPAANEESDATNDSGDWTLGVWFLEESPDPAKKPTDAENRAAGEPEKSTGQTQQQLSEADKEAETAIYGPSAAAATPADGNGSAEGASAQVGASSNEGDEASPADSQTVEALAIIIRVPVSQPPLRLGPDPNSPFALPLTDSELRGISLINHALAMPVGHRLEPLAPAPARQFPDINEGPQLTAREEQIKTNFLHAKWRGDTREMTLWAEVWYREHNVPGYMAGPEFWGQERRAKFGNRLVGVARGIGAGLEGVGAVGVFFVQPAAGIALGAHAADSMQASVRMVISGEDRPTFTQSSITYVAATVGFSESTSETIGVIGDSAMPIVILGVAGLKSARGARLIEIRGTASKGDLYHKTVPWALNPEGPRSLEDAVAFARSKGIEIGRDIELIPLPDNEIVGAYATYGGVGKGVQGNKLLTWKDFLNRNGRVPVRLQESVLASDEAILAVLGHEMHEINALRAMFSARGAVPAGEVSNLILAENAGALHIEGVKAGDLLVIVLRGGPS